MEIYSDAEEGDLSSLLQKLEDRGYTHAYIDGGSTITSFIKAKLLTDMNISFAPVLLGSGIHLFGQFQDKVNLIQVSSKTHPNQFTQIQYTLAY